ncbi:MAG: PAS domain S-box protein [Betaproteobacteria bacterium]|nr:PAS domain S-box protein [Betaproteobacteria bacterium]
MPALTPIHEPARGNDANDRALFWEHPLAFLNWSIALLLAGSVSFLIVLFFVAPEQLRSVRGGGPVVLLLLAAAAMFLLRRGNIAASARLMAGGLWAYATGISLLLGGLHSLFIIAYAPIIVFTGWLFGARAAIALAILTAGVCFGFLQAELGGLLPPLPPTPPALLWVVQSSVFAFSALLVSYVVMSYRSRLEKVRKLGADLALTDGELRARETDLYRAQAVAHVGSWVYHLASDEMRLSKETCRIFGVPEGTTGSRDSYLARTHPEDRTTVDLAWQTALRGGEAFDHEHRILAGKEVRWVRQVAELEFDAEGRPLRSVGTTQDITERKQAEQALRESEARFRTLAEMSSDFYWESDAEHRLMMRRTSAGNEISQTVFGRPTQIGERRWEVPSLLPDDDGWRAHRAVLDAHQPFRDFEFSRLGSDGAERHISVSGDPVFDASGAFQGYHGVGTDITERKRAAKALHESEARFRTLTEMSSDFYWESDAEHRLTKRGTAHTKVSTVSVFQRGAQFGERRWEIPYLSPDEAGWQAHREVLDAHRPFRDFELSRLGADGTERHIAVSGDPVFDEAGAFQGYRGVGTDITERKRAVKALQESEARFRSLTQLSSDWYWEQDENFRFTGLEGSIREGTGINEAEHIGKTRWELPTLNLTEAEWAGHRIVLDAHLPFYDFEMRRPDAGGRAHWVSISGEPMFDERGAFRGYRGIGSDITERKQEEALIDGQKQALEMIAGSAPLEEILTVLMQVRETQAPGMLCSVLLLDRDGAHLRHGAAPSLPEDYARAIDGSAIGPRASPCGVAAYRSEAVIVEDLATDPLWSDYRQLALSLGLRACWSTPIFDAQGKVLGTFAMYHREACRPTARHCWLIDVATHTAAIAITRQQTQAALRESEARYRTLIDALPVGVLLNHGGRITLANHEAARLLGFARAEQAIGKNLYELVPEHIRDTLRARNQQVQGEDRSAPALEFQATQSDGNRVEIETMGVPVWDGGEKATLTIWRDITKRKQARQALHQLSAAVEQSPISILITDASGRIEYVNPYLEQVTGYSRGEIVGSTPRILSSGDTPAETYRDLWATITSGRTWRGEFRNKRKDGSLFLERASIAPIHDAHGRITHFVAVKEDITEFRRTQEARESLAAQLRESQKMEALGTLAGGVAHDFNNIVAAIMGNVELARQDVGQAHPALESLEEIRKASRRAKELVQQILAFGRRQVLERKVIALAPVVEESVRLLRATLPAGVRLRVQCAVDTPLVLADAAQIGQVVLNLCSNAWQATQGQSRPGTIEVGLKACDRPPRDVPNEPCPGSYASLTVRDNGAGMDAATRARIFEPFFTTKPAGEGTGLGLSVVHGIVREHEGSIEVESVPGEGAAFHVYFPAAAAPASAEIAHAPVAATPQAQGKHVLYVDDDEAIVFLTKRMLERQGYRVSAFTDPRDAVAAVDAAPGRFDLVVTDYNMPGMSGLELAGVLREIRADLPVAVASGYITEELRAKAPAAGVSELIYKPDTVNELCDAVARLANALRG